MRFINTLLLLSTISFAHAKELLYVAACSNLGSSMEQLVEKFQKINPEIDIKYTLASSGNLSLQTRHGARYQIFLSADMAHVKSLYDRGFTVDKPVVYTRGAIALFSRNKIDLTKGLGILKDGNISHISIANPKTAPYGIAAVTALKNSHLYDDIKPKLVYANSVSQSLAYATTATDAGIVALSSVHGSTLGDYKEGINWIEIDPSLYQKTKQGMAILDRGRQNHSAKLFFDFMLGSDAQLILASHGYKSLSDD